MYASFMLRVLGYDDAKGDFRYDDALSFAYGAALLSSEHSERLREAAFLRGDLAVLSLAALFAEQKDGAARPIERLISEGAVSEAAAKKYTDILEAERLLSRGFFLTEEENGYEARFVETYSLSEAGYTPVTDRYISQGKGILTDAGWREQFEITALSSDGEESSYTCYSADGLNYYAFADGTKIRTPDDSAEDDYPTTLSGILKRYKALTIEEADGKTHIREELSDEAAERRMRKTVSFLFDVEEALLETLPKEDYSTKLRHCTDTYTLDAEGYVLQWTENTEFYFRLPASPRERPYLVTYDGAADYSNRGRPAEVTPPSDLHEYIPV
jgi:hypothetical protein